MDASKQIKAVAQTYLQEQQLKEQAEYISVLENTIELIAKALEVEPIELVESVTLGRLNLSTLAGGIKSLINPRKSTIGKRYMPGTVVTSPQDPYVGEKGAPRGDTPQGGIPRGLFREPDGGYSKVRRLTPDELAYDANQRRIG